MGYYGWMNDDHDKEKYIKEAMGHGELHWLCSTKIRMYVYIGARYFSLHAYK